MGYVGCGGINGFDWFYKVGGVVVLCEVCGSGVILCVIG